MQVRQATAVRYLINDSLMACFRILSQQQHGIMFTSLKNGVVSEVWAQDESVCRYYTCAAELNKCTLASEVGSALR